MILLGSQLSTTQPILSLSHRELVEGNGKRYAKSARTHWLRKGWFSKDICIQEQRKELKQVMHDTIAQHQLIHAQPVAKQ